jgi:FAD/FMN-containing dehydrogenase
MTTFENDLTRVLGPRVSFDPEVLAAYDHDLGEMPRALTALFQCAPQAVAVPRDAAEVAAVLGIAGKYRLPVTPRGQATSGYGGSVPVKAGIVLDLSEMTRVLSVDQALGTVDVQPGVVWNELSRELAKYNLDNRITPTSAPSSTVGGWFAMGGVGIGSMTYGSIADVVRQIDVAGLDGSVTTYQGRDMELFHQTCGILGVVTRLRLACRQACEMRACGALLPTPESLAACLADLRAGSSPYSLSVQSAGYMKMRAQAEGGEAPAESGFLLVAAYPATAPGDAFLAKTASRHGGRPVDERVARHDWEGRFYPMRIKKNGPSMLVGEVYLPEGAFPAAWREIEAALPGPLGLEAVATADGRLAMLIYIPDNAKSLLYPLRMPKAMIPLAVARRFGGSVYSPGLWFARHSKELFGPAKYRAVMELKKRLDPFNLLNPGKITGANVLGLPGVEISSLIGLAGILAAPLSRRLPYQRRELA